MIIACRHVEHKNMIALFPGPAQLFLTVEERKRTGNIYSDVEGREDLS